jgi:hypothetical protein
MPLRFATPGCLVLSTRRCLKAMASLAGQYTRMQEFTAVFTVLRLLAPLKMSYVAAKKRANLYAKIVEELPQSVERRGSWYDRPSAKAVTRTCWSIIAQRRMRHCRCRHSQRCFAPNGCFRSVNPAFGS